MSTNTAEDFNNQFGCLQGLYSAEEVEFIKKIYNLVGESFYKIPRKKSAGIHKDHWSNNYEKFLEKLPEFVTEEKIAQLSDTQKKQLFKLFTQENPLKKSLLNAQSAWIIKAEKGQVLGTGSFGAVKKSDYIEKAATQGEVGSFAVKSSATAGRTKTYKDKSVTLDAVQQQVQDNEEEIAKEVGLSIGVIKRGTKYDSIQKLGGPDGWEYLKSESSQVHTTLRFKERLEILQFAALDLAAIHEKGILHRDFKPENMMIKSDKDGNLQSVLIADYGLATFLPKDAREISEKDACGTPMYVAPEILDLKRQAYLDGYAVQQNRVGHLISHENSEFNKKDSVYSPQSDTFAFGMTAVDFFHEVLQIAIKPVEIYDRTTGGEESVTPLFSLKAVQIGEEYKIDAKNPLPAGYSKEAVQALAKLIQSCLERDKNNRPEMHEVAEKFSKILFKLNIENNKKSHIKKDQQHQATVLPVVKEFYGMQDPTSDGLKNILIKIKDYIAHNETNSTQIKSALTFSFNDKKSKTSFSYLLKGAVEQILKEADPRSRDEKIARLVKMVEEKSLAINAKTSKMQEILGDIKGIKLPESTSTKKIDSP